MSAALRLADNRVFERINAALPELMEKGSARGITAHDLRHAALVLRILELELQTSSELTNTNLLNLIISDRFLDAPLPSPVTPPPSKSDPRASNPRSPASPYSSREGLVPASAPHDTRTRCDASNPLCVYAESVSVSWALAKIAQAYRSRSLMRYLRRVVRMSAMPQMSPRPFRGMPLFKPHSAGAGGRSASIRDVLQDYVVLYRVSILREFERAPPSADDAWSRAAYAMLLADRAGMKVGAVLSGLRVRHLADVEESPKLGEFIARARRLPPVAFPDDDDDGDGDGADPRSPRNPAEMYSIRTPDRVTHVGIYSLGSPSSETSELR